MSHTIVQKLVSIELLGTIIYLAGKLLPYILVCAVFTLTYIIMPNTKVRFWSALLGGVVAGVLWQTTGWVFASFVALSTSYAAIYSGFAVLILFMIWLYLSWLILLVGAEISFCHQNLEFLTLKKEAFHLSNRLKEKLAFLVMFLIGYNYYHNKHLWTLDSLVNRLGFSLPVETIQNVLTILEKKGLILETGDDPPAYLPARDIEKIKLKELLDSIRVDEEKTYSIEDELPSTPEIDRIMRRIDDATKNALGEEAIKDIVLSHEEEV
jgi:membrane protein